MTQRIFVLGALLPAVLAAQTAVTNASISGVVKDKTSLDSHGDIAR